MAKEIKKKEFKQNNSIDITILIPCRNEEKYIGQCLNSIIKQISSGEKIEVLVIDGMSEDKTREIVKNIIKKHSFIKLLDNPLKIVPTALNIGIKIAKGKVLIRMDAHNIYENNYISKSVEYLNLYKVDNVGGVCYTIRGDDTIVAESIASVLTHPFGVGNSYFRIGIKEPKFVDTVPFGCYKKEVFEKIGLFDENLVRNQDIEFNLRLKKRGGKILLVPEIRSYYFARSTLPALAKNNFLNGFWIIYSTRFAKMVFSIRHLIPFFFILSICGSLFLSLIFKPFLLLFVSILTLYLMLNFFFSFKISLKKGFRHFFPLVLSFCTLHVSYGFGSFWGLAKLLSSYIY